MKKVRAFFFSVHRIFGTIVCVFFFMWFVSGLVLIYHPFPNVTDQQLRERMEPLPSSLPDVEAVLARLPEPVSNIEAVGVRQFQGQTLLTIETADSVYVRCADTLQTVMPVTRETLDTVARRWVDADPVRVDTLHKRDIWIMYSRYLSEMPICKFYYDDAEKHELYIASRTGEVLQFTTARQRFWAYIGAIPHKFYLPVLRQHTDAWVWSLTIGGIIALIAALSGLYAGIYLLYKRYKSRGKFGSPYKKYWYKWHHISGLIFGVFLVTFAFSGAMALQRIPQWVIKTHGDYRVSDTKFRGRPLPVECYALDYQLLAEAYPGLKTVEWSHFRDVPVYEVQMADLTVSIDASGTDVKELNLTDKQITQAVRHIHGEEAELTVSLIDTYEEYYLSRSGRLPLPVYKVEVDNADRSVYYVDPATGEFRYLNRARKAKKWVFSGLHYLNIHWLVERPVLWTIAIWTLCLGGAYVSLSGIWLGIKYLRRKMKRR